MLDRQDIDALLVSALYGELTPADEARLTAHLESHPVDRAALESLTQVRTQVRESRLLAIQLEPPQAISALLLQEAARRAPARVAAAEPRESWFYRFVRSFMSQPAMAAACMLVLVVGMAGVLEMKNRGDFDAKSESSISMNMPAGAPSSRTAAVAQTEQKAQDRADVPAANGELQFHAGAAGSGSVAAPVVAAAPSPSPSDPSALLQDKNVADGTRRATGGYNVDLVDTGGAKLEAGKKGDVATAVATPPAKQVARDRGIEVRAQQGLDVKELAGNDGDNEAAVGGVGAAASGGGGAPGSVATGMVSTTSPPSPKPAAHMAAKPSPTSAPSNAGPTSGASDDYYKTSKEQAPVGKAAPPPPPQAPPPQATPPASADQPRTVAKDGKDADKANKHDDAEPNTAWAKSEHERAKALMANRNCDDVWPIMLAIANRAPAYYAANVDTDRILQPCKAYASKAKRMEAAPKAPAPADSQSVK